MALTITVNERPRTITSAPDTPLLYVLSNELELQGPRWAPSPTHFFAALKRA